MIVCVTGGAGYLASFLIKTLLERGYTVHATLRNLGDPAKVGLLKELPHAETKLKLFEADVYKPVEFAPAIRGCQVVIHMATPLQHTQQSTEYKNMWEATVAGVRSIADSCIRSGTVKKLIYTATVMAASPLRDNATGFKDTMDETCWTPFDFPTLYHIDSFVDYARSKTLAEKEVLSYNGKGNIQVVSLVTGAVGGRETLQSWMPESLGLMVSQATNDKTRYEGLRFIEELDGKVPIVHLEDVTAAHIFCMENPEINGRFLCANSYLKSAEIASFYQHHFPAITIPQEFIEDTRRDIKWNSNKLEDAGFEYKYDYKTILLDSLECAKRFSNHFTEV